MRFAYDNSLKFLLLAALFLGLALILNQGQALPRAEPAFPIPLLLLVSSCGFGLLGFINWIQEYMARH